MILMMVIGGAGMMTSMMGGANNAMAAGGLMAGMGTAMLIGLLILVACIAFVLWVGLTKGDPGENQYGPPPRSLVGGDAPSTPAV
jgi:uncharacterized membrane protein YhaH (DUF805 family)